MKRKIQVLALSLGMTLFTFAGESNSFLPASSFSFSDAFMHEGGVFYSIFTGENTTMGDYGVSYTPRLNFPLSDNTSISADLPLSLGLNFAVNSREGGSGSFTFQLPLKASFNYGLGANDDDSFGLFGGAGLGMGYFTFADGWSSGSGFTTGLYVDAGTRFETSKFGALSLSLNGLIGKDLNVYGLRIGRLF